MIVLGEEPPERGPAQLSRVMVDLRRPPAPPPRKPWVWVDIDGVDGWVPVWVCERLGIDTSYLEAFAWCSLPVKSHELAALRQSRYWRTTDQFADDECDREDDDDDDQNWDDYDDGCE